MAMRRRRRPGARETVVTVPGHRIGAPLGFGANGAVWAARDDAGRDVAVSVLAIGVGEAGTTAMRRLAVLRGTAHPHLARVVDVVELEQGRCALVSEVVPGPTLATVHAARGPLSGGELATLLSTLGSALGHLHERGVIHGDVSPANVVLAPGGVPVLIDLVGEVAHELGTPGFVAPERARGEVAGAAGDVWALARLLVWAGGTETAGRLGPLLGAALDADPRRRPHARDLASLAPALAAREPVRVPPPPDLAQARLRSAEAPTRVRPASRREAAAARVSGSGRRGRRARGAGRAVRPLARAGRPSASTGRRGRPVDVGRRGGHGTRGAAVAGLIVGVVLLVAGVQVERGAFRSAGAADIPVADVGVVDDPVADVGVLEGTAADVGAGPITDPGVARSVLAALLERRDRALVDADRPALATVSATGSPSAAADATLLETMTATGTQLHGLETEVVEVLAVAESAGGAVVDAVLLQRGHERVVDGERVAVPAQPERCVRLELTGPAPWLLVAGGPCE
ncbi:protein kinase [Georgenia sp. MJ206]|uniref:serine/threonine-protein kinase n=1 Tax=Georgenia wangjunii TaxID=3117730 RepID=UPI002F26B6CC